MNKLDQVSLELEKQFEIDVLHSQISFTIDRGTKLTSQERNSLRETGFEIIHEYNGIYTLRYRQ